MPPMSRLRKTIEYPIRWTMCYDTRFGAPYLNHFSPRRIITSRLDT